jgi:hypothetical protein
MEVARHVFDTYFSQTPNPFVRHHLDSFVDFLSIKLPNFIKGKNPRKLVLADNRSISIYIGGKTNDKIRYLPPVDEFDNMIFPHQCRLENKTYALDVFADIEIEYVIGTETINKQFDNVFIERFVDKNKDKSAAEIYKESLSQIQDIVEYFDEKQKQDTKEKSQFYIETKKAIDESILADNYKSYKSTLPNMSLIDNMTTSISNKSDTFSKQLFSIVDIMTLELTRTIDK